MYTDDSPAYSRVRSIATPRRQRGYQGARLTGILRAPTLLFLFFAIPCKASGGLLFSVFMCKMMPWMLC